MLRLSSMLFAAAMLAQPAQAGVMYSWHQTAASPSMPSGLNLELEFSEAAVQQGKLRLDIRADCHQGYCYDGQDSLLALRYWFDVDNGDGTTTRANYIDYGHQSAPKYYSDSIVLDLDFMPGGLLSGWIVANDSNTDFELASSGAAFTVVRTGSDEGPCDGSIPVCSGELGELRIDSAQIPEPSSAAIAGLGLLAAWFARRRRS